MTNKIDHAIVIGIDAYANPEWQLAGAARGALQFAEWVVEAGAGRATPETLTLLLSSHGAKPTRFDAMRATRDAIHRVFDRYMFDPIPPNMGRLWVFYAGHAVADSMGTVDSPPVMVPTEEGERPIDRYLVDHALRLRVYLDALRTRQTGPQFFFVDACRVPTESETAFDIGPILTVNLKKLAGTAEQAALFATTAGKLAHERGVDGLFTRALLDGLRGRGGSSPDGGRGDFIVTIDTLASFVKDRVEEWSRIPGEPDALLPTQVSDKVCRGDLSKVALVRFEAERRPRARLELFVKPPEARANGQAAIRVLDFTGRYARHDQREPLHRPVAWTLPHGEHHVEVIAPEYHPWRQSVQLWADLQLPIRLVPLAYGHLRVEAPDPLARIEVFGVDGRRIEGRRAVVHQRLLVGRYRVQVTLPGHPDTEYTAEIAEDQETRIEARPREAVAPLAGVLEQLGMRPENGLARPSEAFAIAPRPSAVQGLGSDPGEPTIEIETTTATHVGSLLAWALAAARFPDERSTERLRAVGVTRGGTGDVQVLVGDVRRDAVPLHHRVELAYGVVGRERPVVLADIAATDGLARQWCAPGYATGSLRLYAPALRGSLRLPMAGAPGHVSIVIVTLEAERGPELHRYFLPAAPPRDGETFTDAIRIMEDGWRSLQAGVPFLPGEAEELLARDDLDPLTRAVIGFRLHLEDRLESIGTLADHAAPLAAMLADAPGLPDVHVLAALVAAGKRPLTLAGAAGIALRAAAAAGTPLIAAAYKVLAPWLPELEGATIEQPAAIAGCAWTVFEAADPEETKMQKSMQVQP